MAGIAPPQDGAMVNQYSIKATLRPRPLYAHGGQNLLHNLIVDIQGLPEKPPVPEGPWRWLIITTTSGPISGGWYQSRLDKVVALSEKVSGEPAFEIFSPEIHSSNLCAIENGTPHASTYYDYGYEPDGLFSEQCYSWLSNLSESPEEHWVAFRFNELVNFPYLYVMTSLAKVNGEPNTSGGNVYVSQSDSEDVPPRDTWILRRRNVLDTAHTISSNFQSVIEIPLTPVEPIAVYDLPPY